MFFFKINLLVGLLHVSKSMNIIMPNLPLGEYRIVVRTLHPCETTPDLQLQMNLYLSKKARNITEIKGNLTLQTLFDDSVSGTFISSGLNVKAVEDNKAPKVYFYGKYKVIAKLKNKENKLLGCLDSEFDLVRPWEVAYN